jgi:signal transduction histidine kinase
VSDCFGNWTTHPHPLVFKIARPWFNTWWFYALSILLITSAIIILFRSRLNQLLLLQKIRNDIAKDLHDDVGSNLSNIALFNAVAQTKIADDSSIQPLLNKISEYTQLSQDSMSDIVWMITSDNDLLGNLVTKIRNYADSLIADSTILITFQIEPKIETISLSMLQRKNLFLIIKEALNNTLKYAQCSHITISLSLQKHKLVLVYKDDGIGVNLATIKKGNGIINFTKRVQELKGTVEIVTTPENGFMLTCILPL